METEWQLLLPHFPSYSHVVPPSLYRVAGRFKPFDYRVTLDNRGRFLLSSSLLLFQVPKHLYSCDNTTPAFHGSSLCKILPSDMSRGGKLAPEVNRLAINRLRTLDMAVIQSKSLY